MSVEIICKRVCNGLLYIILVVVKVVLSRDKVISDRFEIQALLVDERPVDLEAAHDLLRLYEGSDCKGQAEQIVVIHLECLIFEALLGELQNLEREELVLDALVLDVEVAVGPSLEVLEQLYQVPSDVGEYVLVNVVISVALGLVTIENKVCP